MILYEFPFNERIRTWLRLEYLFRRLGLLLQREEAVDHHFALETMFEIMDVAARSDLKSDILMELDRQRQALDAFRGNPAISEQALDEVIATLQACYEALNAQPGKAGTELAENTWLMAVRNRMVIPGGTCEFDVPAYHAWLHWPTRTRLENLRTWSDKLSPLAHAVSNLLKLLRNNGVAQKVMTQRGTFEQSLPQGRTFQLLRLMVDEKSGLIPEVSGNRLLVSVRWLAQNEQWELDPIKDDVAFEFTLC